MRIAVSGTPGFAGIVVTRRGLAVRVWTQRTSTSFLDIQLNCLDGQPPPMRPMLSSLLLQRSAHLLSRYGLIMLPGSIRGSLRLMQSRRSADSPLTSMMTLLRFCFRKLLLSNRPVSPKAKQKVKASSRSNPHQDPTSPLHGVRNLSFQLPRKPRNPESTDSRIASTNSKHGRSTSKAESTTNSTTSKIASDSYSPTRTQGLGNLPVTPRSPNFLRMPDG